MYLTSSPPHWAQLVGTGHWLGVSSARRSPPGAWQRGHSSAAKTTSLHSAQLTSNTPSTNFSPSYTHLMRPIGSPPMRGSRPSTYIRKWSLCEPHLEQPVPISRSRPPSSRSPMRHEGSSSTFLLA